MVKRFQITIQKLFLVALFSINVLGFTNICQGNDSEEGHYVFLSNDLVLTDLKPEEARKEFNGIEVLGYIQKPEYNMTLLRLRNPLKGIEPAAVYEGGLIRSALEKRGYKFGNYGNFIFATSPQGRQWLFGLKNWKVGNAQEERFGQDALSWLNTEIQNRPGQFLQEVPTVVGGEQTSQVPLLIPRRSQGGPSEEDKQHYVFLKNDLVLTDLRPGEARKEFDGIRVTRTFTNPEYAMALLKLERPMPNLQPTELYLGDKSAPFLQARGWRFVSMGKFIYGIEPGGKAFLFGLKGWRVPVPGLDQLEDEGRNWIISHY